jgi:hypothetical protein
MTLAVMTSTSLGHTGRPLVAGRGTLTIYLSLARRCIAPSRRFGGAHYVHVAFRSRSDDWRWSRGQVTGAISGYRVIGNRVAAAIALKADMWP